MENEITFSISKKTAERLKELMFDTSEGTEKWVTAPIQTASLGNDREIALAALILPTREFTYQISYRSESNHTVFEAITTRNLKLIEESLAGINKENWSDFFENYTNSAFENRQVEVLGFKLGVKLSVVLSSSFEIPVHDIKELYHRYKWLSGQSDPNTTGHRILYAEENKENDSIFRISLAYSNKDPLTLMGQEIFGETKAGDAYSSLCFTISADSLPDDGILNVSEIDGILEFEKLLDKMAEELAPKYFLKFNFVD